MLFQEDIDKYPTVLKHQNEMGHIYFNEEVYNPDGHISSNTRVIFRCITCQEVFDIHGDKFPDKRYNP